MTRTVLILGGRAPVALDHARRFARAGWRVVVADSGPCRLAGWSNAVSVHVSLPRPRLDPAGWAAMISALCREWRVELVLPTCEEVFHVARRRALLPPGVRVLADDFALLGTLHSKVDFIALAAGCGADVPETARVSSLDEAREWAGGGPLVLKPEFSRFGVHVRLHPQGLPREAAPLAAAGPWAAQRFHAGRELCSYAIADAGALLACATYRPAWRLPGSASFYFEPVDDARIRDFTAAFVGRTGYTGQIGFDWIEGADGRLTVIECNPRATSGLHLFAPDDALPARLAGEGGATIAPGHARPAMLAAVMAGAGLAEALRRGDIAGWWRDLRRADDVLAPPGDRRPFAGALADVVAYAGIAIGERCALRAAMTRDIEWDGEERVPA